MSFLVALAANWRWLALGFAAVALAWVGFYIRAKIDRAAEADRLEVALRESEEDFRAQVAATRQADLARMEISRELAEAESRVRTEVKEVVRHVREKLPRDPRCDIPVDLLLRLNEARGHSAVPGPTE